MWDSFDCELQVFTQHAIERIAGKRVRNEWDYSWPHPFCSGACSRLQICTPSWFHACLIYLHACTYGYWLLRMSLWLFKPTVNLPTNIQSSATVAAVVWYSINGPATPHGASQATHWPSIASIEGLVWRFIVIKIASWLVLHHSQSNKYVLKTWPTVCGFSCWMLTTYWSTKGFSLVCIPLYSTIVSSKNTQRKHSVASTYI